MGVDGSISKRVNRVIARRHSIAVSGLVFYIILFLVSGSAGLIYQVVWEKLLQLYFGVTTFSVTLIVAAYMCGLGLGSLWGGHYSRKVKSPSSCMEC